MSFLSDFFGRKSGSRQVIAMQDLGRPVRTPREYGRYSQDAYQKNVIAFAAIQMVATACAGIDWVLYRKRGNTKVELEEHSILDLLNRPNPMQTRSDLIESLIAYKLIAGNSFLEGVSIDNGKTFRELWILRPDRMEIVPGVTGLPAGYIYKAGMREKRYPVDVLTGQSDVMHWKGFNPLNDWYGQSSLDPASLAVEQHNASSEWNLALLQNGGKPSGAIFSSDPDKKVSKEVKDSLREQLENRYGGPKNAGRMMLLEGGLDWKQMGLSPTDMDWMESRNTSARDVALAFGVPPMLIGIPGDNTYSNQKEARVALFTQTVLPLMDGAKAQLNRYITARAGPDLCLDYNRDDIEALEPLRQVAWEKAKTADFLTINEKRESVGYGEIEGGDVLFVSSSLIPLEDAQEPLPDPAAEPDDAADDEGDDIDDAEDEEEADAEEDDVGDEDAEEEPKAKGRVIHHGHKIARVKNESQAKREWLKMERLRSGHERNLARCMARMFKDEKQRILKAIEGVTPEGALNPALAAIEAGTKDWQRALEATLTLTADAFGRAELHGTKMAPADYETKDAEGRFSSWLNAYIKQRTGEKISGIKKTSEDEVRRLIKTHVQEAMTDMDSDGLPSLSKRISKLYDGFTAPRSEVIARTETNNAANSAIEAAGKATQILGLKKRWVAVRDDRVRDDHSEVDTDPIEMDEDFLVGGYMMARPGDDSKGAPASQIVNCRCKIILIPPGADDERE